MVDDARFILALCIASRTARRSDCYFDTLISRIRQKVWICTHRKCVQEVRTGSCKIVNRDKGRTCQEDDGGYGWAEHHEGVYRMKYRTSANDKDYIETGCTAREFKELEALVSKCARVEGEDRCCLGQGLRLTGCIVMDSAGRYRRILADTMNGVRRSARCI